MISIKHILRTIPINAALRRGGNIRCIARGSHDFVDYDVLELQVENNMKLEAEWIESNKARKVKQSIAPPPSQHFKAESMHDYFASRGFENGIEEIKYEHQLNGKNDNRNNRDHFIKIGESIKRQPAPFIKITARDTR